MTLQPSLNKNKKKLNLNKLKLQKRDSKELLPKNRRKKQDKKLKRMKKEELINFQDSMKGNMELEDSLKTKQL